MELIPVQKGKITLLVLRVRMRWKTSRYLVLEIGEERRTGTIMVTLLTWKSGKMKRYVLEF